MVNEQDCAHEGIELELFLFYNVSFSDRDSWKIWYL